MATMKAVVRAARRDGFYPVYIRVTHHRASSFIKTDKMVTKKSLTKNNEIKDPFVLQFCTQRILEYTERLNKVDIGHWTVKEVADFLVNGDDSICFSDYARQYIRRMIDNGQRQSARSHRLALENLERFAGTSRVMLPHMTSQFVNRWIQTLAHTRRAKELYPICMKHVFKAAMMEYNDYELGIIRIKANPWVKVSIPPSDRAEKKAITPEECRAFFSFPLPEGRMGLSRTEFGRDVAMMVLCLAGMNAVDLYHLRKEDYSGGIIRYQRAKTKKKRADGAYMEMRVPPILDDVFRKYMDADDGDGHLFNFYRRMSVPDSFCVTANSGIRQVCELMGIPREQRYSTYTFRHTWGTVAQNDVRATIAEVAFAMNHSAGYKVTRGYIKTDYTPAWELNEKVVDFIFFSGKTSVRERRQEETKTHFRLSCRLPVRAEAFHQGRKVAELEDVGFGSVEEVIRRLAAMLPGEIPVRSVVMFKITDLKKGRTMVCQRMKGAGF